MPNIAEKLRAEINDSKEKRHQFIMRKFALSGAFLGAGSIELGGIQIRGINLSLLLYLSPLISIAFDLYIFSEDYRIKRAGSFIRIKCKHSLKEDCDWEEYVKNHQNVVSSFAFFAVTMIMLFGAILVLYTMNPNWSILIPWASIVFIADLIILIFSMLLRKHFDKLKTNKQIQIQRTGEATADLNR